MDDPHLQHVAREAAARGRSPGWRVRAPQSVRLFTDSEYGSTGAALDAALAWRDEQLDPRHHVPAPAGRVTLAPGIYLATDTVRGNPHPVIKASADDADGKRHAVNRSLLKHTPEDAIQAAAEMRFRVRNGRLGFTHETEDALFQDALAAYQAYVRDHPPAGVGTVSR